MDWLIAVQDGPYRTAVSTTSVDIERKMWGITGLYEELSALLEGLWYMKLCTSNWLVNIAFNRRTLIVVQPPACKVRIGRRTRHDGLRHETSDLFRIVPAWACGLPWTVLLLPACLPVSVFVMTSHECTTCVCGSNEGVDSRQGEASFWAALLKLRFFSDFRPCRLVKTHRRFGVSYCPQLRS